MSGVNGRVKGQTFERDQARVWGLWVGDKDCIWRTATSGARGKHLASQGGDLAPAQGYLVKGWCLSIELKNTQTWSFENFLRVRADSVLGQFWKQARRDAKRRKFIPILVVKRVHLPPYVIFGSALLKKLPSAKVARLEDHVVLTFKLRDGGSSLRMIDQTDFLKIVPASLLGIKLGRDVL